jgi:hypothetical protein
MPQNERKTNFAVLPPLNLKSRLNWQQMGLNRFLEEGGVISLGIGTSPLGNYPELAGGSG